MFNKKSLFILFLTFALYTYFKLGITYVPAEELDIPSGVAMDIIQDENDKTKYYITTSVYNFGTQPSVTRFIFSGTGDTIGSTRQSRQVKMSKKFILGLERIVLASEDAARFGIEPWINILFANPNVSDTGYLVVCKGKANDIFSVNIPGFPSSSDYMDGMITHAAEFNFFSNNYKLLDVYIRMGSEGKNVTVPYVEYKNNTLQLTGMAIFKKDKMVRKISLDEARPMNLLRENNVRGLLSIIKSPKANADFYATSKRKVKCKKVGDKYTFTINLSIKGNLVSNLLYKDIYNDPKVSKKFEKDMSKEIESMCNEFIDKMQREYKIDCLELGQIAAAKYGRGKVTDWDDVVSKAEIKVNVETKLDVQSRGDYTLEKQK